MAFAENRSAPWDPCERAAIHVLINDCDGVDVIELESLLGHRIKKFVARCTVATDKQHEPLGVLGLGQRGPHEGASP